MALLGIVIDEGFLHLVGIFLLSGVKFLFGLMWAIAFAENDFLGLFISVVGGVFGSFIWIFLGHWILEKWVIFTQKRGGGNGPVKRFSRKNRFIVRVKRFGGVYLLVLLAPIIISIPVGCLVLTTIESNRFRLLILMTASVILWGIAIYFGVNVTLL
ncbi:MAG: hypothetical protein FJ333_02400 [Sphingomonadales bacterium]|nr:hypothetical protein [Sphingomonadales bacterium]